jgi:hypothetical protein
LPTKEDDDSISFCGDKSEEKDVFDATVVAFEGCFAELMLCVERNLLVSGADEVVDDVGTRCAAAGVAEPFVAGEALDDAAGGVDPTISTRASASHAEIQSTKTQ